MRIIKCSDGITERQAFQITKGGNLARMKDNVGRRFDIVDYIRYEDERGDDEKEQQLLAIVTAEGDVLSTNSGTIIRTFDAMIEQFELPITDVEIYSQTNPKNGRTYLNIALV